MNQSELDILQEIRDLLMLMAEPQLAERDKARRSELKRIAGKGSKNIRAVLLMDGSRNQSTIAKEAPIDPSQLAKLVKVLGEAKLLKPGSNPAIVIPVSESMFAEGK